MFDKEAIETVLIQIKTPDEVLLLIFLSRDGTINRQGNGKPQYNNPELFVGKDDGKTFRKLLSEIDQEVFEHPGLYTDPSHETVLSTLTLLFKDRNSQEARFEFRSASPQPTGVPMEIRTVVAAATALTDDWWIEEIKKREKSKGKKGFWK